MISLVTMSLRIGILRILLGISCVIGDWLSQLNDLIGRSASFTVVVLTEDDVRCRHSKAGEVEIHTTHYFRKILLDNSTMKSSFRKQSMYCTISV